MSRASGDRLLIAQGGGPTAVMNGSLYGVVREALSADRLGGVFGARNGIRGVLRDDLIDLGAQPDATLEGLRTAPGAALGSSRDALDEQEEQQLLEKLREWGVRWLLLQGGNGSMTAALRLHRSAEAAGHALQTIGVPKTVDNDLPGTDRCPGFGSAARYVAQSVRDLGMDIRALPTPVSVFETLGRHTGWVAAASALGRERAGDAPHRIYLPERAFEPERFLGDVDDLVRQQGWAVVAVSEGLSDRDGRPLALATQGAASSDAFGRPLPGDVGNHLAGLVSQRLGLRCRSEKPGLCARSSALHVSSQDQADAEAVGRAAVRGALAGRSGEMVTLEPLQRTGEALPGTGAVPLAEVAEGERRVPQGWIDPAGNDVTEDLTQYTRPLIGEALLPYARLETTGAQGGIP